MISRPGRGDHAKRGYRRRRCPNHQFQGQFADIADACALAQSIVDTVREPACIRQDLRVIAASRSSIRISEVRPEDAQGRLLYASAIGQWNIPKLRVLLEKIIPEHGVMEGYEVEQVDPISDAHDVLRCPPSELQGEPETTILLRHRGCH